MKTRVDYAFNLVAAGVLRPGKHKLGDVDVVVELLGGTARGSLSHETAARRLRSLVAGARGQRAPHAPESPTAENLATLAEMLQLDQTAREVLTFTLACHDIEMQDLLEPLCCANRRELFAAVAGATAQNLRDVEAALHSRGRLRKSGLVTLRHRGEVYERLELDSRLADLLTVERLGPDAVMERFLPVAAPPSLSLEDYAHLAPEVRIAQQLLAAATRQRRAGTNVLLYGPTGTGKSELARLLARQLDLSLYIAGREDEDGDSPTVQDRLRSFMLGNRLLDGARALLLFDEMEDLFAAGALARLLPHAGEGRVSKQWFNNLLETNPVPAVWISNDVSDVDPAFLRRFTYVIEVPTFTASQRRRAWHKHLGGEGRLPPEDVERLALRLEVSPAQIGNAVAAARLAADGEAVTGRLLEAVLTPSEKIVRGRRSRRHVFQTGRYLPEVVNTPVDLEQLTERLVAWGAERTDDGPGVSLCLYGPPGTGKSAYVAYLARRLDRPLLVRRPSDLLGAYVGETESSIAEAFQEALRDRAVLLFDEADTFLHDRRQAQRSWEVSQVNELLQQLEVFAGIVACTTNLLQNLDQASLRRFSFKLPFGYRIRSV